MAGAVVAENEIPADSTFTLSSEDSSYPSANLIDRQAANVCRGTSGTTWTIEIDAGVAILVDTIALINHNWTSGASVSLKADTFSPPTTVRVSPSYRANDIWASLAALSLRYWLLTVTDTNSDPLQLGQVILGTRAALPRARRINEGYVPGRDRANLSGETYAGLFWKYHLYERRKLNPSFRIADAAELAIFQNLDQAVYGDVLPFVYIPEVSEADVLYVRKEPAFYPSELNKIAGGDIAHDYAMELIEESRGLDILE
jgi:hypothetical protein